MFGDWNDDGWLTETEESSSDEPNKHTEEWPCEY